MAQIENNRDAQSGQADIPILSGLTNHRLYSEGGIKVSGQSLIILMSKLLCGDLNTSPIP